MYVWICCQSRGSLEPSRFRKPRENVFRNKKQRLKIKMGIWSCAFYRVYSLYTVHATRCCYTRVNVAPGTICRRRFALCLRRRHRRNSRTRLAALGPITMPRFTTPLHARIRETTLFMFTRTLTIVTFILLRQLPEILVLMFVWTVRVQTPYEQ